MISNRNLSVVGHRTGLTQYIGLPANRMDWATGQKNKVLLPPRILIALQAASEPGSMSVVVGICVCRADG